MKSVADTTASPGYFAGPARLLSRYRLLIIGGLLALLLLIAAAVGAAWLSTPVKSSPLSGTWACSMAGQPIGNLSVDRWDYVMASSTGQTTGTLERVVFAIKYKEEIIRVHGGPLAAQYGVKIGYHYKIAGKPESLVFSIGPASGIVCSRA